MKDLFVLLAARLREPSSQASLAAMLVMLHISLDPGTVKLVIMFAAIAASIAGFFVSEKGQPFGKIASDALAALDPAAKVTAPPSALPLLIIGAVALGLTACSQAGLQQGLSTPAGRVACSAQLAAGGILADMIPGALASDPGTAAVAPVAGAVAQGVRAQLDQDCAPPLPAATPAVPAVVVPVPAGAPPK